MGKMIPKPNLVAWDKISTPKYLWVLGFRDVYILNLTLSARQGWRLLQHPNSLTARLLKAVY
jgi:hypothetical protein